MIPDDAPAENPTASLYDVLCGLGFGARERVSICTQLPGERFKSQLHEVADLAGWTPPQDRNVWFGVNPVGRHVRYGRGTEADITRVRALFADFDVKPGQFAALWQCYEAKLILDSVLGIGPVALIESGHGLQPIWRVGSPPGDSNVIDRDRSRDDWKLVYQRWGSVVQDAARNAYPPLGGIDNVFELSRVLRCPGSVNWKDPDNPVPVRAEVFTHGARIRPRDLVAGMDEDNITPLGSVRVGDVRVETNWGEATEWITQQLGAELELADLRQLPPTEALTAYLDPGELVRVIAGGDGGAHATMRDKVLHAVFAAQEGRAGLVVALNNIGNAYLEVLEARERGELPGDARPLPTGIHEIEQAVRGAVAKARGRTTVPNVRDWATRFGAGVEL